MTHHNALRTTPTDSVEARTLTLSPKEVAECLGIGVATLANWRWAGRGPRYVKVGGRIRYRVSDIMAYLDAQTRNSTSDGRPYAY